jgi:exonuclease III
MQLTILSYNIRGLNDPGAVGALQHYVKGLQLGVDIFMLQEHKLRNSQAQQLGRRLWRGAKTWCLEATVGYNNAPQDEGVGRGGVATLLSPRWGALVTDQRAVMQNKAHWFIIRGTPGRVVTRTISDGRTDERSGDGHGGVRDLDAL